MFLFVLFSLSVFSTKASAHDLGSGGSEGSGWVYVGSHWGTNWTYYFDATSSSTWLNRFKSGETKFEGETADKFYLWEESSSKTSNFVENYSCSSCGWVARRNFYSISSDHPTRWRIQMNSAKTSSNWNSIVEHEIGHVFGLADLYNSSNSDKLMYYSDQGTVSLKYQEKNGLDWIY
jgi:Matrixin